MTTTRISASEAVQRGAMEGSEAPVDLDKVRRDRLANVHRQLARSDLAGVLLFDQLNVRYAIDATNMQVWCLHNEVRYCFVATDGPVILFEFGHGDRLTLGYPGISERRPARAATYFTSGNRAHEHAREFAREIADVVGEHGAGNRRIGIDRMGADLYHALENENLDIHDGFALMEEARKIKTPEEIVLMRCSIEASEKGIRAMRENLRPGITENALWAKLHEANIAEGGRMDRDPSAVVGAAHQPLDAGVLHEGDREGRHGELRHRPRWDPTDTVRTSRGRGSAMPVPPTNSGGSTWPPWSSSSTTRRC